MAGWEFSIRDNVATDRVHDQGDLPDLFREGQGIVATGRLPLRRKVFEGRQVLAKHDETYMPKQVADSLKAQGEWRGDAARGPAS
jgi:cytochrome c-type biogenesis protein CcmE